MSNTSNINKFTNRILEIEMEIDKLRGQIARSTSKINELKKELERIKDLGIQINE